MEERLRFYEEGIAPSKNADAMQVRHHPHVMTPIQGRLPFREAPFLGIVCSAVRNLGRDHQGVPAPISLASMVPAWPGLLPFLVAPVLSSQSLTPSSS